MKNYIVAFFSNRDVNINDFVVGCSGVLASIIVYTIIIPRTIVPRFEIVHLHQSPSLMPTIWTIFIFIVSLIVLLNSFSPILEADSIKDHKKSIKIINVLKESYLQVLLLVAMIIYLVLKPSIGYVTSMALCLFISFITYGFKNIYYLLLLPAIVSFGLYYFFREILKVYL